jgi:molybdopterin-containing oxidoreductase family membrane subunit
MYAERITIIPLTLATGRSPFDWGEFTIHYADIAIPLGTMCFFIFLYLLASRVIPLVPVWEVQEGQEAHILRQVGKTRVPSVSDLE